MIWHNKSYSGTLLLLLGTAVLVGYISTTWIVRLTSWGEEQSAPSIREALIEAARTHSSRVVFPDSVIDLYTGDEINLTKDIAAYPYIIVSIISVRCSRCIEDLPRWDILINDFTDRYNVRFIFFATGPTREYVKLLHERLAGDSFQSLYYDAFDEFTTMNHFSSESRTFLLGPERMMILAGTPAGRTDIMLEYMNYLGKVASK